MVVVVLNLSGAHNPDCTWEAATFDNVTAKSSCYRNAIIRCNLLLLPDLRVCR